MSKREYLDRKCKTKHRSRDTASGRDTSSSPVSCTSESTVFPVSSEHSDITPVPSPTCSVTHTPYVSDNGSSLSGFPPISNSGRSIWSIDRRTSKLVAESIVDLVPSDSTLEYPFSMAEEDTYASEATAATTSGGSAGISPDMAALLAGLSALVRDRDAGRDRVRRSGHRHHSGSDEDDRELDRRERQLDREERVESRLTREIHDIAAHKEGQDIIKYINKLEGDLREIGCPQARWKHVLYKKMTSSSGLNAIYSLNREDATYEEVKAGLIRDMGSSLVSLGAQFISECSTVSRSSSPLQCWRRLKDILDSIMTVCPSFEAFTVFIASAAYRASLSSSQKASMDLCKIERFSDLHGFASSLEATHITTTSCNSGIVKSSKRYTSTSGYECFKCHKMGHRAFECRSNPAKLSTPSSNSSPSQIICYTCREPGHKSPDCPSKNVDNNSNAFDSRSDNGKKLNVKKGRTFKANWIAVRDGSRHVEGYVNGIMCKIIPDTGAEITVVPGCLVYDDQLCDESVSVRGWDSNPVDLQTAIVEFMFEGRPFRSKVAVAHEDRLSGAVLFSIPMDADKASKLLLDAALESDLSVSRVEHSGDTPDVQPSSQEDACSGGVSVEAPETSTDLSTTQEVAEVNVVTRSVTNRRRKNKHNINSQQVSEANPVAFQDEFDRLSQIDMSYSPPTPGDGNKSMDASVSGLQGDCDDNGGAGVEGCAEREGKTISSQNLTRVCDKTPVVCEKSSDDTCSTPDVDPMIDIPCPVLTNIASHENLILATQSDDRLESCRALAMKGLNGYSYTSSGLLTHTLLQNDVPVERIVIPSSYKNKVLTLAHDKTSHVGVRGMRHAINRCFTWPGSHTDICNYVKSCEVCLKVNSSGNKKSKMIERRILTVPFDSVAVDLVGPLPKAKRGVKYLFTYVCLSTRWPEAVPMRTASAAEAAQCFVDIISRTGIPSKVLSDRGTIFLSKLMSNLCEMLGIAQVASSPYRPQSNGVVERLHGTLKPMLAKAVAADLDWSEYLPLALFTIRQVPNRDLGVSPHCLVYGREVMGPLDILYDGWSNRSFEPMDVDSWLISLNDKLSLLQDFAVANQSLAADKRKLAFDKNKSDKQLEIGSQVLMRVPGVKAALQAAWEGPYTIKKRSSRVTYLVSKGENHPTKVAHRDNLKVYVPRPFSVNAVTLIAEDQGIAPDLLVSKALLGDEVCPGFRSDQLAKVLDGVGEYFSDKPGLCRASTCQIHLADGAAQVNLPPRQIPSGIRQAVREELDKLLAQGVIVESESAWASPLVPVRKRDGSVRICVDFRQLNTVTPLRRYWLPSLAEILVQVGPCNCLSTLDLTAGFHQLEMDASSSELTTFVCPFGKFKYQRMPFGLKNAPAIFQAVVESVLKPVSAFSRNYVDDIVIFSDTWEMHLTHIEEVIICLGKAGFTVKRRKCIFGRKHLMYLGHKIGSGTLAVPKHRADALANFVSLGPRKSFDPF